MVENEKVCVVMSAYNGEKYIKDQIESIMHQKDVDVILYIRDDGSRDQTIEIIKKMQEKYPGKIFLIVGENVGFAKSFYECINEACDANYYAFSDQDDVWEKDKLITGINAISKDNKPSLYFCNAQLVDDSLNHLRYLHNDFVPKDYRYSILENPAPGCTMVFNRNAKQEFLKIKKDNMYYHDHWMLIVCSFLGNVYYDEKSHIKYRQHGNNVVGVKKSFLSVWENRFKQLTKNEHSREYMAKEFLLNFADNISKDDEKMLKKFSEYRLSLSKRLRLIFSSSNRFDNAKQNFWMFWHIIFGNV